MKLFVALLTLMVALGGASEISAQQPKGYWHQDWIELDGERTPHINILPVYVYSRGVDLRRYRRLVAAVKAVYPLAKRGKEMMEDVEGQLAVLETKKEQNAYVKEVYKNLLEEYKPVLKKMTRSQGKVLLRLINRETEYTAYNIVYEYRGKFLAGFWQGVSKIFGQDLKAEYGEADEDAIIEQIIVYYEAGLL